jgi:uncharacterized membrane protein YidH (DUF202 family)
MADPESRRPVDERKRLPMRLAVVAFAYIVYRLIEPTSLVGALLVGFGVWLVGVGRVERQFSPRATERQRMLQSLGTRIGIAMIAVGTVLAVV